VVDRVDSLGCLRARDAQVVLTRAQMQVCGASMKELRDRIDSVQNTKKITEAMKLVAAAKVRRAQDAVVNGRPFAENLVKVRNSSSAIIKA
jgi:F-type H+-transporting ATPase subunit gamma